MAIQLTTKQTAMKQLVLALSPRCLNLRYRSGVWASVKCDLFTADPRMDSIQQPHESIYLSIITSVFNFKTISK
jgi:hypothetical protein